MGQNNPHICKYNSPVKKQKKMTGLRQKCPSSLQHIQLLISLSPLFTTSHLLLHLQNGSSYFLFFYFIIFIWCTKQKGHLLFRFIYRRSYHLSSSSFISLSFFDAQNENLIFPSKTLENFLSILSSSVHSEFLEKLLFYFFQVISNSIFKHEWNNEFIEEWWEKKI